MEIQRDIFLKLERWRADKVRKPLLMTGARQIGKTWVMETFGRRNFEYCVKFDFDRQPELRAAFINSKEPDRILRELSTYSSMPIIAGKTLIIFDEIQECEEALNCLKYFCEDAPQYHVIAAGSLLGVAVKKKRMAVPVGKVTLMRLYPLSFAEFLRADDKNAFEYVKTQINAPSRIPEPMLNRLLLSYRRYMVSGGMPEPAVAMIENLGITEVDTRLKNILDLYELDFSKYAEGKDIPRIRAVWHSLPSQLGKENRKFIYNVIRSGARSKDYEDALMWLEDAGMIHRVHNISKPGMPLSAYSQPDYFKVYAADCGQLRRLANLPGSVITDPLPNYTEFKGAMAENAVLQSFFPLMDGAPLYYWSPGSTAEIEFVVQWGTEVIPVEVKAGANLGGRSLSVYNNKYAPRHRIRLSTQNLQYNGGLLSCPLPLAQLCPLLLGL